LPLAVGPITSECREKIVCTGEAFLKIFLSAFYSPTACGMNDPFGAKRSPAACGWAVGLIVSECREKIVCTGEAFARGL